MKFTRLCLLLSFSFFLAVPLFSQPLSNTDNVITLNNTCLNGGVSNGTYNLELYYYDQDQFTSPTVDFNNVSVAVNNGVMTITAPSGSFPSLATNGRWSLPDAYPGYIKLTSGAFSTIMFWYQNPDGSTGINCVPLPIDYNSFTGTLSGSQVVLNWQTGLEQNSTYIEIYRYSGGSGGYYKIGQVPAAGNSSLPVNYTFTDPHPCSTNVYYLKMLNSQGTPSIFSNSVSVGCSSCSCSLPSPVFCNFTINGPDHICSLETPTPYSLSSPVPNYSTIAWSLDIPNPAHLNTYPAFDRTQVSLLMRGSGSVVLTATLSGCTNAITKTVVFGVPNPSINAYVNCPDLSASVYYAPGALSYTWSLTDEATGIAQTSTTLLPSYGTQISGRDYYDIGMTYTNGCGTSLPATVYGFNCPGGGIGDPPVDGFAVSPNPSSGVVSIGMTPPSAAMRPLTGAAEKSGSAAALPAVQQKIYLVRVTDAAGNVRKTFSYPQGEEKVSVNISDLNSGIYTIQVYNKKTWSSRQVVLAK